MGGIASKTLHAPNHSGDKPLWKDGASTASTRVIPRSLVISISGECSYDHIVELCFHFGRNWRPRLERLVLDFTNLKSADHEGLHFLVSQLTRSANDGEGEIYIVRAPSEVRALLNRAGWRPAVIFVTNLAEAVLT